MKLLSSKLLFYFLICIICTSCGNCTKEVECPGFNNTELVIWFPYIDNQELLFKSNTGETEKFTLKLTENTKPYTKEYSSMSAPVHCIGYKKFESLEKDVDGRSKLKLILSDPENTAGFLIFNQRYFDAWKPTDTGFQRLSTLIQTQTKFYATLAVGNKTFPNVQVGIRDTTNLKTAGFYKIYLSRSNGLVGYEEYPSLKIWVKDN